MGNNIEPPVPPQDEQNLFAWHWAAQSNTNLGTIYNNNAMYDLSLGSDYRRDSLTVSQQQQQSSSREAKPNNQHLEMFDVTWWRWFELLGDS